jgi:hypothetical protein
MKSHVVGCESQGLVAMNITQNVGPDELLLD